MDFALSEEAQPVLRLWLHAFGQDEIAPVIASRLGPSGRPDQPKDPFG